MKERAFVFGSEAPLVGVLTEPCEGSSESPPLGVVLLNAGVIHHTGPHRLYVNLARRVAEKGAFALRFDHSGIGDSGVRGTPLPFAESSVVETREAMDWLERELGVKRFVLLGLCSGTLTAFRTAMSDGRVVGLALLTALLEDPSTVSEAAIREASERRIATSYAKEKAFDARSWMKVLTGRADYRRIARTIAKRVRSRFQARSEKPSLSAKVVAGLRALLERGVAVSFVFSEPTTVLEYFRMTVEPAVAELRRAGPIEVHVIERSDHTFSGNEQRARVLDLLSHWLVDVALPSRKESGELSSSMRR